MDSFVGSIDPLVWTGFAGLLLTATVAGFIGGVVSAPALLERSIRKGMLRNRRLYDLTLQELDRTARLCHELSRKLEEPLEPPAWSKLETARQSLTDAWRQLADRQLAPGTVCDPKAPLTPKTFRVEWKLPTNAGANKLPDRAAFDDNLKLLLDASDEHCHPSGLLLIQVDKSEQLATRYGYTSLALLQQKIAAVIVKAVRDSDLVCRLEDDRFAVLLPAVSPLAGARIAETIRTAVREHTYRLDDVGSAILVTGSFGYATCLPHDPPTLILDRAGEALEKSQGTGRNQLHVHDASSRVLSKIG